MLYSGQITHFVFLFPFDSNFFKCWHWCQGALISYSSQLYHFSHSGIFLQWLNKYSLPSLLLFHLKSTRATWSPIPRDVDNPTSWRDLLVFLFFSPVQLLLDVTGRQPGLQHFTICNQKEAEKEMLSTGFKLWTSRAVVQDGNC